jgi:nucleoside-diphosphate-sugar epimerase
MRVVVTGATGNAGTALLRALEGEPAVEEIVGIARRRPALAYPKVRWVQADVATDDLAEHLRGASAVVHLAWLIQPGRRPEVLEAVNVRGTERLLHAAAAAGVDAVIHASSIGAYSPRAGKAPTAEDWPTDGIPTSTYSRQKVAVERMLERFAAEQPGIRVAMLRPALIFQRSAGPEIRRYFAGPFVPTPLLGRGVPPLLPLPRWFRVQGVHSDDVADAYRRLIVGDARGAFNVAADPLLDPDVLGRVLHARPVPIHPGILRAAADAAYRLRVTPAEAGWLDMGFRVPVMDTARARAELGWTPARGADAALADLIAGMREGAGLPTPPLDPHAGGRARWRELATGVGARN